MSIKPYVTLKQAGEIARESGFKGNQGWIKNAAREGKFKTTRLNGVLLIHKWSFVLWLMFGRHKGVSHGKRAILYDGIEYPSIAAAARAHGISREAMRQRVIRQSTARQEDAP